MKYSSIIFIILFPLLLVAQTVEPIYITLNGDITNPHQEVSGLAWHNDDLIILPQYPRDVIYSIPKVEILEFLDSIKSTILPNEIKWNSNKIDKKICGFEGFESITFDKDTVYLTIEAEKWNRNRGYLVKGNINGDSIILDKNTLRKVKTPIHLRNITYETILLANGNVNTIYEVNSATVNEKPYYFQFDKELKKSITKRFPFVEYRITDATEVDSKNKFWVVNYFWPGDYNLLKPDLDYIISNKKDIKPVERLLEFKLLENEIIRTERQPVNIQLSEFGDSRNWEGIVRLDDIGFLIVTDKFPGTILAFLPYSE